MTFCRPVPVRTRCRSIWSRIPRHPLVLRYVVDCSLSSWHGWEACWHLSRKQSVCPLGDLKAFAEKSKLDLPTKDSIKGMFNLLDVGKTGQVDLELLKYGLTSIGSEKFGSSETEEFYKSLNINLSETKTISIDQMVDSTMKLLSDFK
ncbi:hypothetical protein OJ253_1895 [Cryptosporidium canis]|uniref:EF-hand domain-containing protein n=1 Tax=Cryptosporidium canis TaxID=195482 RepID=A0A9D5HXJ0_9CRYT|nr:hypothetical protein OJ253_1895 [Cryptosporidium canis]